MTLVELMVALSLFSVLLATSLGFYQRQGEAFTEGNSRMTVMQNLRYAVNVLEQNVRTAGVGVPTKQPVLIYADDDIVAFNADYATNRETEVFAVYHDRLLPDDQVTALTPDRRITLPGTSFTYPDSAYFAGSGNSPAETLVFFFAPDSSTAREDDFSLYRQVNDGSAELVARRLLRTGVPFFRYYVVDATGTGSPIRELDASVLPAAHDVAIHGSPADTGSAALVDSVRAIRVTYAATNGRPGDEESVRQISRLIRLPNAGVEVHRTCGAAPALGGGLSVTGVSPSGSTGGHVRVSWPRSLDEQAGERDVLRYVIWRRPASSGSWGDPLVSLSPTGSAAYVHQDFSAEPDTEYRYAVAAQDCTPLYSAMITAGPVEWLP